jgi:hypothetical protein
MSQPNRIQIGSGITIGGGIGIGIGSGGGGGGGALITGTITVGTDGSQFGYNNGFVGSASLSPSGVVAAVSFNGAVTQFGLYSGTNGGITVVGGVSINGSSTFTITVDGIAQQVVLSIMGTFVPGDPFGLSGKIGQTLSVSIVIP